MTGGIRQSCGGPPGRYIRETGHKEASRCGDDFTNPIQISDDNEIIACYGRVEAATLLDTQRVPTLRLAQLDAAQRRSLGAG